MCGSNFYGSDVTLFSKNMQQNYNYLLIHKNSNHILYVNCNCDCIMAFLANSTFILQISHAKTFKMRYTRCRNSNLIRRYSQFHFMYGSNFYESDFIWLLKSAVSIVNSTTKLHLLSVE